MMFLNVWWCFIVAAIAEGASIPSVVNEFSVTCDAPTPIYVCGMLVQVLPPTGDHEGRAACSRVCAGGTQLRRSLNRLTYCAAADNGVRNADEKSEGTRCVAGFGTARLEIRCRPSNAQGFVSCDRQPLSHTIVRRQSDETNIKSLEEATTLGDIPATDISTNNEDAAADEVPDIDTDIDTKLEDATASLEDDPTTPPSTGDSESEFPLLVVGTMESPDFTNLPDGDGEEANSVTALPSEVGVPMEGSGDGDSDSTGNPSAVDVDVALAEETNWEQTLTISLGVLVAVLVVGIFIGGYIFWRWRRTPMPMDPRAPGDGAEDKPLSRRVAVSALEAYVTDALRSEELRDQHLLLPRGSVRPALCARRPDNRRRNRYNDLVAYDDTRVILKPFEGEEPLTSDYINANYIDGYARQREFIAAQAPLSHTAADFWRMVWQEGVRVVVTLCAAREAGVEKCFQYWPAAGGAAAHGPIAVTCAREDTYPDLVVRELRAARAGETRQVVQIQFTGWPDHGVPRHPEAVSALLRRVVRARATAALAAGEDFDDKGGAGPLLVHCSAGVGRTGTVLLAMTSLAQARAEGAVDALALLQRMRRQRPNLVDQAEQYEMAHRVLVDALLGAPLVAAADASLGARVREAAASGDLHAQWRRMEHLSSLMPRVSVSVASLAASTGSTSQLGGSGIPTLLEIDGHRARARFVAMPAAAPPSAWRQVAARGLRIAVLLQEPPEGEGPWPMAPTAADVNLRVTDVDKHDSRASFTASLAAGNTRTREQRLELRAGGVELSMRLLRAPARWPTTSTVPDGGARPMLKLWRAVTDAANFNTSSEPGRVAAAPEPVLLLCADGRRGCGLFAGLSSLLEQMQAEGEMCVSEAVLTARRAHDTLICSEEQLLFLYESAVLFVEDTLSTAKTL